MLNLSALLKSKDTDSELKMSKKKKKVYKKNYMPHIIITALIISIGGYFGLNHTDEDLSAKKAFKGYQQFDFRKDGELTFQTSEGNYISQIDIEIADDMVERAVGLMYRDEMKENQGMFFIFPREEYQSFWMKNTVLSLDILFINKKNEIVTIHKSTVPFSEESYPSTAPAIYVLEVNAGYTEKYGIKEGDKIIWRVIQ